MKTKWKDTLPVANQDDLAEAALHIAYTLLDYTPVYNFDAHLAFAAKIIRNWRKAHGDPSERLDDYAYVSSHRLPWFALRAVATAALYEGEPSEQAYQCRIAEAALRTYWKLQQNGKV